MMYYSLTFIQVDPLGYGEILYYTLFGYLSLKLFFSMKIRYFFVTLCQAQGKKARAEKLLAKIEASMVPINPCDDQETITDEERSVFRRIGLRMKAYLPLGQF